VVFRRRRRGEAAEPGVQDEAAQDYPDGDEDGYAEDEPAGDGAAGAGTGPWDGAGAYPAAERMDFGSLLVPVREGLEVQINMAEDQGVWIAVLGGDNRLQL
jgi:hypothetical protein